ncbi:leucyl/phenylalanyl-tRNA--protein transferase [uncultured Pseudoteredinibacter sp.]|uniref:leucyl/phenylalanyl-tRNA--protein transferase n=1 Tax=uncultured Pseudoteredinibacter sp. TaxID=1641701 RepID=UPI002627E14B|nr:leucyl/phenylalanyl-tRNA--protein transferase [uncultured Pseudoteredinibacter sp.]
MIELPWLLPGSSQFPPTSQALEDPNGLLAAGGELDPDTLLSAYRQGIFPWFDDSQPILWWSPSPRAVIIPGEEHISRSLRKHIRRSGQQIRCNTAFAQVMEQCAAPRADEEGTWITDEMLEAYLQLHKLGHAHSVETWQDDTLVGGLYGLHIGSVFFGESMFSKQSNASKFAFASLCQISKTLGIELIDCQVSNPHLTSLGSVELERGDFEALLGKLVHRPANSSFPVGVHLSEF